MTTEHAHTIPSRAVLVPLDKVETLGALDFLAHPDLLVFLEAVETMETRGNKDHVDSKDHQ